MATTAAPGPTASEAAPSIDFADALRGAYLGGADELVVDLVVDLRCRLNISRLNLQSDQLRDPVNK